MIIGKARGAISNGDSHVRQSLHNPEGEFRNNVSREDETM